MLTRQRQATAGRLTAAFHTTLRQASDRSEKAAADGLASSVQQQLQELRALKAADTSSRSAAKAVLVHLAGVQAALLQQRIETDLWRGRYRVARKRLIRAARGASEAEQAESPSWHSKSLPPTLPAVAQLQEFAGVSPEELAGIAPLPPPRTVQLGSPRVRLIRSTAVREALDAVEAGGTTLPTLPTPTGAPGVQALQALQTYAAQEGFITSPSQPLTSILPSRSTARGGFLVLGELPQASKSRTRPASAMPMGKRSIHSEKTGRPQSAAMPRRTRKGAFAGIVNGLGDGPAARPSKSGTLALIRGSHAKGKQ